MSGAAMQIPQIAARCPIHGGWDGLFLCARTTQKPGKHVAAPEFDAELHIETTTIMFADVVESVRLIEQDELGSVTRIRALLKWLSDAVVPKHSGVVLERRGDGLLIKFPDARCASACALALHANCALSNDGQAAGSVIALRIGVHGSAVLSDNSAIYGQGINLAARVTSLAGPGETVVSASVRDGLIAGLDVDIEDLGECFLKHVPEPLHAFRLGRVGPQPIIPVGSASRAESFPTIAVLPFEIRGDPSARTASELLGETLSHYLARAGGLTVIAWLSSKPFGTATRLSEVRNQLKVDWLLKGSCTVIGQRIVVSAQLIRAANEVIEHSERLTESLDDLLQPESEIAARLAKAFVQSVTEAEAKRVAMHALPSLSSHSLLLGAVGLMHRSGPDDFHRSKDALEHLLDRQPRMHSARPWLAKWYVLRTTRGMTPASPAEANRALEQTSRALDSQDDDAFALAIQGFVLFHMLKDAERAREKLSRAVRINPNEPLASVFNAALVSATGDFEGAWALAERALVLSPFDPLRPYMRMIAAACALSSERFEVAAELARQSLRENAMHAAAWRTMVIALVQCDQIIPAREACARLMRVEPSLSLKTYEARLMLPEAAKVRAVSSLRIAGVPAE